MVLCLLLTALFPATALAEPVAGAMAGVGAPLESPTRSEVGPELGLYGGWGIDWGSARVQPEVVARLSLGAPIGEILVGAAVTWGDPWRLGPYLHTGIPVLGGYPFPAASAGLVAEHAGEHVVVGLRAGYELGWTVHVKCGNCAQPADHMAIAVATVGWAGG